MQHMYSHRPVSHTLRNASGSRTSALAASHSKHCSPEKWFSSAIPPAMRPAQPLRQPKAAQGALAAAPCSAGQNTASNIIKRLAVCSAKTRRGRDGVGTAAGTSHLSFLSSHSGPDVELTVHLYFVSSTRLKRGYFRGICCRAPVESNLLCISNRRSRFARYRCSRFKVSEDCYCWLLLWLVGSGGQRMCAVRWTSSKKASLARACPCAPNAAINTSC
jgi:hypothetical protein